MRKDLRSGDSLESYFKESYSVEDSELQPSTVVPEGKMPELLIPDGDPVAGDISNAIALHEYYMELDETQASDPRLWSYLSHVQFRTYTLARWGFGGSFSDLKDETEKNKAKTYFFEHWFVSGNDRDLRRHAIARLWWAAHLTYAPWESDPEFFDSLKNDDPYHYTKLLLLTQDIYQQVLERSMGRSNRILIHILDFLGRNPEFAKSREKIRSLMKELNLAYGTKKIIALDHQALSILIEKIAADIDKST